MIYCQYLLLLVSVAKTAIAIVPPHVPEGDSIDGLAVTVLGTDVPWLSDMASVVQSISGDKELYIDNGHGGLYKVNDAATMDVELLPGLSTVSVLLGDHLLPLNSGLLVLGTVESTASQDDESVVTSGANLVSGTSHSLVAPFDAPSEVFTAVSGNSEYACIVQINTDEPAWVIVTDGKTKVDGEIDLEYGEEITAVVALGSTYFLVLLSSSNAFVVTPSGSIFGLSMPQVPVSDLDRNCFPKTEALSVNFGVLLLRSQVTLSGCKLPSEISGLHHYSEIWSIHICVDGSVDVVEIWRPTFQVETMTLVNGNLVVSKDTEMMIFKGRSPSGTASSSALLPVEKLVLDNKFENSISEGFGNLRGQPTQGQVLANTAGFFCVTETSDPIDFSTSTDTMYCSRYSDLHTVRVVAEVSPGGVLDRVGALRDHLYYVTRDGLWVTDGCSVTQKLQSRREAGLGPSPVFFQDGTNTDSVMYVYYDYTLFKVTDYRFGGSKTSGSSSLCSVSDDSQVGTSLLKHIELSSTALEHCLPAVFPNSGSNGVLHMNDAAKTWLITGSMLPLVVSVWFLS